MKCIPSARVRTGAVLAAFVTAIVLPSATAQAADRAKILSEWPSSQTVVDGVNTEWSRVTTISKDVRLSIGVRNDDQHLFIALITSDSATSLRLLNEGLIVWIDSSGGTKKRFGIKYPIGREPGPPSGSGRRDASSGRNSDDRRANEQQGPPPDQASGQPPDTEEIWKQALSDNRMLRGEILGPGKDAVREVVFAAQRSIKAKLGRADGMVVYEMSIAIGADRPNGLTLVPGAIIGIGVETPERKPPSASSGGRGGPGGNTEGSGGSGGGMGGSGGGMGGPGGGMGGPGGGMGGPGGGMGGPGGGMGGPGGPQQQKALSAWTTALLAAQPAGR
jgi:hypothetical protein